MSSEKRAAARLLSEYEVVLHDPARGLRGARGLAHDVSLKGFRVETAVELREGQLVDFELLLAGPPARGRARVVWTRPGAGLSRWSGLEFARLSWSDRRRIRRASAPESLDWARALWTAVRAALGMLLLYGGVLAATSEFWWSVLYPLAPVALAGGALLWSGIALWRR